MSRVNSREILHERHHLLLLETLVNEEIVLLMHGSVASLAGSAENFESSAKGGGVPGVPCLEVREVSVSVMETNGVHLFFVTLDTVRCTNVISEDPGLGFMPVEHRGSQTSGEHGQGVKFLKLSVNRVVFELFHFTASL